MPTVKDQIQTADPSVTLLYNMLHGVAGAPSIPKAAPNTGTPWYDVTSSQFGATGNGYTDDTAAVQSAISAAANSSYGGTVFFPPGVYGVSGGITGGSNVRLLGTGWDLAVVRVLPNTGAAGKLFNFDGFSNVRVEQLTLDGNRLNVTNYVTLLSAANSSLLVVQDAKFTRGNYFGVEFSGRSSVTISRCHFEDFNSATSGGWACINNFVGVPPAARPTRISVENCVFINVAGTSQPGMIALGRCDDCRVIGNQLSQSITNTATGIALEHCRYSTVAGNVVDACDQAGIRVSQADVMSASDLLNYYISVTGNVCRGMTTYHGIALRGNRITCTGNICDGNTGSGIDVNAGLPATSGPAYTSKYLTITGNQCTSNTAIGINFTTFSGGSGAGVLSEAMIAGNTCQGNVAGIRFTENASGDITDVTVVGNDLRGNTNPIDGTAAVRTRTSVYIFDNPAYASNLMLSTAGTTAASFTNATSGYEVDDSSRPGLRIQRTGVTAFEMFIDSADNKLKLGSTGLVLLDGSGNLQLPAALQRSKQTPTETVLVSGVDATAGELVVVTLTAARLVGAPLNSATGQRLSFTLIQNATGGFAVTWNAVFKVSWADTGNTANKRSTVSFVYDGTNWNQDGAQTPYV